MLNDMLHRLGRMIGSLDPSAHGGGSGPGPRPQGVAVYDPETGEATDWDDDAEESIEHLLIGTAGAWLLARLLRPRGVSWPRVVVAGAGAAILADIAGRAFDERRRSAAAPLPPSDADEATDGLPHAHDPAELVGRMAAGVGLAAGYASLLYPRLPGPPLVRGLAFGALELAASPHGGLARLAARTPGVKFPLQALALPVDEDAGPVSLMAFGLGLGLLYRYDPGEDEDDDADEDEDEDDLD